MFQNVSGFHKQIFSGFRKHIPVMYQLNFFFQMSLTFHFWNLKGSRDNQGFDLI